MTKKERCKQIALANPGVSRQELIELFVDEVGMSHASASSYASSVMKDLKAEAPQRAKIEARKAETDEEIEDRLAERFEVIDDMAVASCEGRIRSLIISGPAGLGKSFAIERALRDYDPGREKTVIAKGFVRPTGLYKLFHDYRYEGNVIVFDDCDAVFGDQDSLNLLKAACDTTQERVLSWRSETKMTDVDGVPVDQEFTFEGTVIFITNIDFDAAIARGGKGAEHFEALISRSHYIDCDMHTIRDYMVRIRQVVRAGMLREIKGLDKAGEIIVMDYIEENASQLRELTLRMALKLADVYLMNPAKFRSLAKVSCLKGGVRH